MSTGRYAKLHDTFHLHRKVASLEDGPCFGNAVALWALACSWSSAQLTDGVLTFGALRKLVPFDHEPAAMELVRVQLWECTEGGYKFHQWDEHQDTRSDVESQRARWRKNKTRSRVVSTAISPETLPRTPLETPHECLQLNVTELNGTEFKNPSDAGARVRLDRPKPETPEDFRGTVGDCPQRPHFTAMAGERIIADTFSRLRSEAWLAKRGKPGGRYQRTSRDFPVMQEAIVFFENEPDPSAAVEDSIRGFLTDEWATEHDWPFAAWAREPGKYMGKTGRDGPLLPREGVTKAAEIESRLTLAISHADALLGVDIDQEAEALRVVAQLREDLRRARAA